MLALSDRNGCVGASVPGLAKTAGVTLEQCEEALARLHSPDPHSRSKEHGGRRVAAIERGWQILNYQAHRNRIDPDNIRAAKRRWWNNNRSKEALERLARKNRPDSTQAAPAPEAVKKNTVAALPLPSWLSVDNWNAWVKTRPVKARSPEALKAALKKLDKFRAAGHDPNEIVANSLANGWRGLFEPDKKKGSPAAVGTCSGCGNPLTRGWTNTDKGKMCGSCYKAR